MARTAVSWFIGVTGTYIYPGGVNGYDILINGSNHYINFGTLSGTSGYGIRDNGGTMEFKNSGGSWTSFGSGGGSTTFIGLTDVPATYTGAALKGVRVNAGETALEFFTMGGGTGTVTSVSVVTANGFAGTVANDTTTPAITITTSITGVLKGNGTAISAATAGSDYAVGSIGLSGGQTIAGSTLTTENLTLRANAADLTTGAVIVTSSKEASSSTVGSVQLAGGLAVAKRIFALDMTVTNTISGSITGNAGTATAVAVGGITGLGTNVATALAVNVGSAGAFVTFNGDAGTPSAIVLTNATGTAASLTAGVATLANTVASANEATDTTCFILFQTASGTTSLATKNNTGLTYNSNTNAVGATTFVGALTGNASTASAVAVGGITGLGTNVATALAVNVGSAGAFVVLGGALGTPSSGTVTNLTGTASININGTVGATTPTTGVFTTLVAGSTTSLLLGTAGSAVGNIGFRNATSGTITVAPPTGALGTVTLTLPAATDTLVGKATTDVFTNKTMIATTNVVEEITTTASSATPTPTGGSLRNFFTITALAAAAVFAAPSGSPVDGNYLTIRVLDNNTARALSFNAIYRGSTDLALPTTTTQNKTMYMNFRYNSASSTWDYLAQNNGF